MNLREELLRGIYAYGFEKPSAIQARAILPCIKGKLSFHRITGGTDHKAFRYFSGTWMEKIISKKIGDSLEAGNLKFITMLPEDTLFIFNYYLMLRHLGQLKNFEQVMGKKSSFIYFLG